MPKRHLVDLAATATRLADNTHLWESLVEYDPVSRYYARLALTREHEAWLLTWVPGQGTDWHDHGGSAGAFTVVRGALTEEHAVLQGDESAAVASTRELGTGSIRPFGTRHIHRVTNTSLEPAVSIHVYAPALRWMNTYRVEHGALVRTGTEKAGVDW